MAQSNNSHYFMATPQDFLSTPYGYAGQMSPETAVAEQALNRRRYLANLLVQQGLQQAGQAPSGQMVGRFYVGASPLQGFANLAQAGVGLGMGLHQMNQIDTQQSELAKADRQSVVDAIQAYQDKIKQKQQLAAAPVGVPTTPPSSPPPGPAAGSTEAAIPQPEAFRGIAPAQPPDDHTGVSDFRARPDTLPFGQNPSGVSQTITPGDMSQFANSANPAMAQEQLGTQAPPSAAPAAPVPTPQPTPGQSYRPTMNDLADLITHQHPTVQAYGRLLAQQMMQEQEHQRNQGNLDRTYNLDKDRLAATNKLAEAQLASRDAYQQAALGQQGDLTRATQAIARQKNDQDAELKRLQLSSAADLKKSEIESRSQMAKSHNETLQAIAQMKQQGRGQMPAQAMKERNDELDAIGAAAGIKSDMASIQQQMDTGKLDLGFLSNLQGEARNKLGLSNENSRNLASFKSTLEHMRNESLRLNKGVQTEGDSVRAWNELINNINDPGVVRQRLSEIQSLNDRALNIRKMNVDMIHKNYGLEPMNTSGYETQPAAVGASRGMIPRASPAGTRSVKRTGMHNGKKVVEYSDGSIEYAP